MKDGFVEGLLLDGRYKTVSPLNHGSFGMVFLALDITNDEQVAVKCLAKSSTTSPCPENNGNDHLVELLCHDRLGRHPGIVNLLHAFETDAHMFLVLEFCSMGDLYEAIRLERGPRETGHVRDFMMQLVNAVEFMHAKGLYHRDIKPENIFLAQDGSMKLGDFGLSTTETWTYEASVGSDRYMAPEQFDPAENGYCPAQADIWAIGICLLNILFSKNPFVTPSESDILFADFVRDRQSLFDIFPAMSQDTFEVLKHALAIDPEKRSLPAIREALERVVSFTADDDLLDDFCTEDREVVPATANRQPLRTPSIQSPPVEQGGAFPWAKALQMSPPQPTRQLSAIPDVENDGVDLFPDPSSDAWFSPSAKNASMASVIDSALGASVKSMHLREPRPRNKPSNVNAPTVGSLPVTASKPIKAMSNIFGKKENVSKSWSDLWDEEEEEELEDARRRFNNRNWSSDSIDATTADEEDMTVRRTGLSEIKNPSVTNSHNQSTARHHPQDLGVFVVSSSEDVSSELDTPGTPSAKFPAYSPPAKRSVLDKWVALGNRRRAANLEPEEKASVSRKRTNTGGGSMRKRGFGLKAISGSMGNFKNDSKTNLSKSKGDDYKGGNGNGTRNGVHSGIASTSAIPTAGFGAGVWGERRSGTDKVKEIPGVRIRDWRRNDNINQNQNKAPRQAYRRRHVDAVDDGNDGDVEWVGGWHDLHL